MYYIRDIGIKFESNMFQIKVTIYNIVILKCLGQFTHRRHKKQKNFLILQYR